MVLQKNISNAEHLYQNDNPSGKIIPFGFIVDNKIVYRISAYENSGLGALYLSNPKIINLNHLEYLPNFGDIWNGSYFEKGDGEHFLNEEEIKHPFDNYPELLTPFAFLVNNKVALVIRVLPKCDLEKIFNSDPKIVNLLENNDFEEGKIESFEPDDLVEIPVYLIENVLQYTWNMKDGKWQKK